MKEEVHNMGEVRGTGLRGEDEKRSEKAVSVSS
jgi:hypothetical protein